MNSFQFLLMKVTTPHYSSPVSAEQNCDIIFPSIHQVEGTISKDSVPWTVPSGRRSEFAVAMTNSHQYKPQDT